MIKYSQRSIALTCKKSKITSWNLFLVIGILSLNLHPAIAQPIDRQAFGKQLLNEVFSCLKQKFPETPKKVNKAFQEAMINCFSTVAVIDQQGELREDASERMTALLEATGVELPKPRSSGTTTITLLKTAKHNSLIIPVTIGKTTNHFLLDTGSSNTIISHKIANRLKISGTTLPPEALQYKAVIGNNLSQVNAKMYNLPPVKVNTATVTGINSLGLPLDHLNDKISGILGMDYLNNFDLIINPQQRQIQLLKPTINTENTIALRGKFGVMIADVKINDRGPYPFLIDTGADITIISPSLADELEIKETNTRGTHLVFGIGGVEIGKPIQLSQVALGPHQIGNLEGLILDNPKMSKMLGVRGILGQNFLNNYHQHWRFSQRNVLGFPETGSLLLTPINN